MARGMLWLAGGSAGQERLDAPVPGDFLGEFGAHIIGVGNHTDSPQVEAIRVPAGADGRVFGEMAIGMPNAGLLQQGERGVIEVVEFSSQFGGVGGSARTMTVIAAFIFTARIVKQGEESDHDGISPGPRGEEEAALLHTPPMGGAVCRVEDASVVLVRDDLPEMFEVDFGIQGISAE